MNKHAAIIHENEKIIQLVFACVCVCIRTAIAISNGSDERLSHDLLPRLRRGDALRAAFAWSIRGGTRRKFRGAPAVGGGELINIHGRAHVKTRVYAPVGKRGVHFNVDSVDGF